MLNQLVLGYEIEIFLHFINFCVRKINHFFRRRFCTVDYHAPINLIDQLQLAVTVCAVGGHLFLWCSECACNLCSLNKLANECTHFLGALFATERAAAAVAAVALARKTSRTTNLLVSCNLKAINRDYYGHNLCFLIIIFLSLCRSQFLLRVLCQVHLCVLIRFRFHFQLISADRASLFTNVAARFSVFVFFFCCH